MKHCAKKLLGLAFALALCLAVGGTALAETPVLADVSDTLPEQEMLDYEPNVTTAAGEKTIDRFATDGYTVTIPTTVTFNSGENKGELEVKAKLKQYRTLNIGIESPNNWKLKYQGAAEGTTTPEVDYILSENDAGEMLGSHYWQYIKTAGSTKDLLVFAVAQPSAGTTGADALNWHQDISAKLPITVPTPSQATMSGTYSDTLVFTFKLDKQCVTYTINVYGQKLALTSERFNKAQKPATADYKAIDAVNVVDENDEVTDKTATPETYTLEYGFAGGSPVGNPSNTWTRPRPADDDGEDTRCWENLTYDLNLQDNYNAGKKNIVVNLNLKRKWCWLDVNGITNKDTSSGNLSTDGNQGSYIGSYVNIKVSDGTNWSDWYWYSYGDDYWGTFPYGTKFQLGLHRVKDGYVYDADAAGNVAIYANGNPEYTQDGTVESSDKQTHYRVYEGELKGKPYDEQIFTVNSGGGYVHAAGSYPRYCYNPCYVDGITYYANDDGGGGREDTNNYHGAHTSFKYTDDMTLAEPMDKDTGCAFTAPEGKVFAGWSTTKNYTAGQTLYAPGTLESAVEWPARTSTSNNDTLPTGDGQNECRVLYAIWGYKVNIKVQFENEKGYTAKDPGTLDFTDDQLGGFGNAEEVGTQVVYPGAKLTLNAENQAVLTEKIKAATMKATGGAAAPDDIIKKVWQLDSATVDKTINSAQEVVIEVKRQRHMVNIISVLLQADSGYITTPTTVADARKAADYGSFKVWLNDAEQTNHNKTAVYQCKWNYGATFKITDVTPKTGYKFAGFRTTKGVTYTDTEHEVTLTGKDENLTYFNFTSNTDSTGHTGDTIYVMFTTNPGPSHAPAKKKVLTVHYHANFDPNEELALDLDPNPLLDDMDDDFGFEPDPLPEDVLDPLEGAVMTVTYKPDENVVLRHCMFKRAGYVFVGWNTEKDGTGKMYEVNGVPVPDWAAGATVDLYAQWEKPHHMKPVVDDDSQPGGADPAPTPQPGGVDDDFGVDPQLGGMDDAFGIDPAQPEGLDDAFGVDPDPLPEALDDAFGV